MKPLHTDLFSLDQMAASERERCAYLAGDLALAAFIGDANDAEEEVDELKDKVDALSTQHTALQADLKTAMDWMLSDKCTNLASCKELAKRFKARLATIHTSTKGVENANH